jgi:uncharacterized membrane protein
MNSWTLQPIAHPIILLIGLIILLGLLFVRPSFGDLTRSRRFWLSLTRAGVIGMAAIAMFRPGCVSTVEKSQSAVLPFIVDVTRSMQLPHQDDASTRWSELKKVVRENQAQLNALRSKDIDVKFYAFDNGLQALESEGDLPSLPDDPEGAETDIGSAIQGVMQDFRGQRMLGMVLASDGVQNVLEPEVEVLDAVDDMAEMQVPLFAVPFGLPANVGQLADIAITNLPDQHAVFVKNQLTVNATLVSRGFANKPIPVQLLVSRADRPEEIVVDEKVYTPKRPYEEVQVNLVYKPTEPGQYRIKVRAIGQPTEAALRNNELPAFLTVYDGGISVLYLEGNMGNEQVFLRRSIKEAAQGIDIDFMAIYSHTRPVWPLGERLKRKFNDKSYDIIIIGDLDSRSMYLPGNQEANMNDLAQLIGEGKGLMMLGGYHSFGPGLYHRTPLANVLPIRMGAGERQDFDRDIRKDLHIMRPIKVRPTGPHYLTKLDDAADPAEAWKKLPPLKGANRFVGIKDSASVLLEGEGKEPILVTGNYGSGRVAAFAGDTTWLWWMNDHVDMHKRFWRQILLWLAFRDGSSNDNVWIDLPQRRFQPRSQVSFTTGARNSVGDPIPNADYEATLVQPGGVKQLISVSRSTNRNWAILERDLIAKGGLYKIEVAASRNGQEIGKTEVEFIVFDQDREISNPAADPKFMARLADQTGEYGGKAVLPDDLGKLLEDLAANPPEMKIEVPQKWQLGQTFGDSVIFLLAFVAMLTFEWALRKKWGLI